MAGDLSLAAASELLALYRMKLVSPVAVVEACLKRVAAENRVVNAYCLVDEEGALTAARDSEARWAKGRPKGSLDGVPVSIKDLILTKDWPTLRGSRTIDANQPWNSDAPVSARLKEQGAIALGKTTTPEFGWKGVTDNPLTGITRNPFDPSKTPGGSSGGAAAAVACGMGPLAIGTDGGGSIRIPAGFTGIFGLKPSYGRVPAWPPSIFGTLAHLGPMTRTVTDAALLLNVISAPDWRDWSALPAAETQDFTTGLEDGVAGLRIAFSMKSHGTPVDAEVAALVAAAAKVFAELGAAVEEVDPEIGDAYEIFRTYWWAGARQVVREVPQEKRSLLDPRLRAMADTAAAITLDDYFKARQARGQLGARLKRFSADYPILLTPTLPIAAFAAGLIAPEALLEPEGSWVTWTPFSYPFNLSQQPAATVPCGFTEAGLPVGLQIVGPMYDDKLVLRVARAFEKVRPWADSYSRIPGLLKPAVNERGQE
jgi:aspartyl-tRNA(Asn)/glutamyl-tRNA(Gln) amidotransferase subunit A